MADGVQDQNIRDYAVIDAAETTGIVEGMALQFTATGTVEVSDGSKNFAGIALPIERTIPAVAGQKVALDHWGTRKAIDSGVDVFVLGDPMKVDSANAGEMKKWVRGVDGADLKIGYVAKLKDGNDIMFMRMGGR